MVPRAEPNAPISSYSCSATLHDIPVPGESAYPGDQSAHFESLLAGITARFLKEPVDRVDVVIEEAQRLFCENLALDRSSLWQFSQDGSHLLLTHLYQTSDAPPCQKRYDLASGLTVYWAQIGHGPEAFIRLDSRALFPWICERVRRGEATVVSTPGELPDEASIDRQSLVRLGTKSTVVLPLLVGGTSMGCLTFATMREPSRWPAGLVERFRAVADLFASALARSRSDRALQENEKRYRSITQNLPGVVYQFYAREDGRWGMHYVDGHAVNVCGLRPEPLDTFFDRFTACIAPECRDAWMSSIREAIQACRDWEHEVRFTKPDGQEVYLRCFSRPERLHDELVFYGFVRDITMQKRAEIALRESQGTLNAIVDSTSDLIWSVDPVSFGLLTFNRGLRDYFLKHRDLQIQPGMRPEDLLPTPEYAQTWREFYQKALSDGSYTIDYETSAGTRFLQLSFSVMRRDGSVHGISVFAKEITSQKQAEEALRRSEQKFRTLHESMMDAFVSVDMAGRLQEFNAVYQRMLGYSAEELHALTYPQITPEEWHAIEDRIIREQVLTRGYSDVYEKEYRRKDGTILAIELRVVLLRDGSGQPTGMFAIIRDITERKQAEDALAASEQRFRALAESALVGIYILRDGRYAYVNPAMARVFGYSVAEMTGMTPREIVQPCDHGVVGENIRRRITGEVPAMQYQVRGRHKDGSTRDVEVYGTRLEVNGVPALVGTLVDITERKRAEDLLHQSEERFRQVAEAANDFIWEVDAEGLYTYTSPSVEKILGYTPEELVGKLHFYDVFAPDVREGLKKGALEAFATRRSFRGFANANVGKNGKIVHLETSGAPILDQAGNLMGYRGADTDVTERKRAEEELRRTLEELKRLQAQLQYENVYLRKEVKALTGNMSMVGNSAALLQVLREAQQVAPTDSTVLILGETGTGKELLAQYIHSISGRAAKPFIMTNIAAIPTTLLESELFGREKGAYTGAIAKQIGRIEMADGGTLLLDEIGEMPLETQAKLLRVLESGDFERLGSGRTLHVNFRVIAATNRNLQELAKDGKFRQDLFYRLNVFPITLPPLRERRDDIPMLVWSFVKQFSERMGKPIERICRKDLDALQAYDWPGNVRELRNVVEHSMILSEGDELHLALPKVQRQGNKLSALRDFEKEHILQALKAASGKVYGKTGAAKILGLKPTTLYSLMKRLGIERT